MKHIILECANFAPHDELQKGFANYYMETNYVDENRFLNQKLLQTSDSCMDGQETMLLGTVAKNYSLLITVR